MDPRFYALPLGVWVTLGLISIGLFFSTVTLCCYCLRVRRWRALGLNLALLALCYLLMEGFLGLKGFVTYRGAANAWLRNLMLSIPPWMLITGVAGLVLLSFLLWRRIPTRWRRHINPMSVKEAVDKLPMGICCWLPGGQILLANAAMESLCRTASGQLLRSGEELQRALTTGPLAPGCRLAEAGGSRVLLLPDGTARALTFQQIPWEGGELTALLAADVTETWGKTQELEARKEKLSALNRRLAGYNREIVDLTIQAEILTARIRLHDALGENLLTMKQLLARGASPEDLETLRQRLLRNVSFLKSNEEGRARDEYNVLLRAAESLGVQIRVEGNPPEAGPLRRVVATGLHECLTNLLRHAHGNQLLLELRQEEDGLTAVYSGNGAPPAGPVRETGGLHILRTLTEQLGGTMTVTAEPTLQVRLKLPKEDSNGL